MQKQQINIINQRFLAQSSQGYLLQIKTTDSKQKLDQKVSNFHPNNTIQLLTVQHKLKINYKMQSSQTLQNKLKPSYLEQNSQINSVEIPHKFIPIQSSFSPYKQIQNFCKIQSQHSFQKTYTSMLQEINRGFCFQQQNLLKTKQFLYEKIKEMDQKGLLTEEEKSHINTFINFHLGLQSNSMFYTQASHDLIKLEDSQQDYIIVASNNQKEAEKSVLDNQPQISRKNQLKVEKSRNDITKFIHPKYIKLLNDSLKQLKLYKDVRQKCIQKKAWVTQQTIAGFIYKMIAIKKLFPLHFESIVKTFVKMVHQFNEQQSATASQIYAKQVLSSRYINCVQKYAQDDDIQPILYELYGITLASLRLANKLDLFLQFKSRIEKRIQEQQKKQQQNVSIPQQQQPSRLIIASAIISKQQKIQEQLKTVKTQLKDQQKTVTIKLQKPNDDVSSKPKRKGYPTKNFLALFKFPHRQFIMQKVPKLVDIELLAQIFAKNWITKQDYCILYTHSQLQDHWKPMFQSKKLYRSLLLSRANIQQKKYYIRKIFRFQDAYKTKSFDRIN